MKEDTKKTLEEALRLGGCPDCPSCAGIGRRLDPKQLGGILDELIRRKVSINDVARRAGIAPGGIYSARSGGGYGNGITATIFEAPLSMLVEDHGVEAETLGGLLYWAKRPTVEEEVDDA